MAFPAFLGSFWAAGWCKGTRAACVTHWRVKPGSGRAGDTTVTVEAARRDGLSTASSVLEAPRATAYQF